MSFLMMLQCSKRIWKQLNKAVSVKRCVVVLSIKIKIHKELHQVKSSVINFCRINMLRHYFWARLKTIRLGYFSTCMVFLELKGGSRWPNKAKLTSQQRRKILISECAIWIELFAIFILSCIRILMSCQLF